MAHYRERSGEVMALVGELGRADAAGLARRGLPRPHRDPGPDRADERPGAGDPRAARASTPRSGSGPTGSSPRSPPTPRSRAGSCVLTREQAATRFAAEPPRLIPGVGPKTAERLEALGVRTIGDLQAYPRDEPRAPVRPQPRPRRSTSARTSATTRRSTAARRKSRSVETTFDYDIADLGRARAGPRRAGRAGSRASCASAGSAGGRSGSRSGSTTGPRSPACTRSTRRPTTRR